MGAAQSVQNQAVNDVIAAAQGKPAVNPNVARDGKTVAEAFRTGNQIFLEKDVKEKVSELSKVFEDFNNNDYKGLLAHIERINERLRQKNQPEFELSEKVKKSLVNFHSAILSGIDTDMMGDKEKNAAFKNIMSAPGKNYQENLENVFKILGNFYGSDLENKKNMLLKAQGIVDNPALQDNLSIILNVTKALKVKYKFFEYKYIELNIFLILLVQHFFQTFDSFATNILAFNKMRDETRQKLVQDTLNMMVSILKAADLDIDTADIANIKESMEKLRVHMDKKNQEMETRMRDLVAISTDNLSGFVSALTDATRVDLLKQLQAPGSAPGLTRQQSLPASALSGIPGVLGGGSRQKGGFPRDGTLFPQAFYDIEKIDMPPHPGSTHGPANDS